MLQKVQKGKHGQSINTTAEGGASVAGCTACGVTTVDCTHVYIPSVIISSNIISLTIPAAGSKFKALHRHHEWNENGRQDFINIAGGWTLDFLAEWK